MSEAIHETLSVDHQLIVYQQNVETFRSLNQLMWQIPLIAMTLTGGLWFGVSRTDASPILQLSLLGLAAIGNAVLIVVLGRLRYIMGRYLDWLGSFYPPGFVSAPGDGWWLRPRTVQTMFQIMLGLATGVSVILMATTVIQANWLSGDKLKTRAVAFYDKNALALADAYEGLSFQTAHPELHSRLSKSAPLRILDVGAGSGRDAAAMADLGHSVTAVEPSEQMRALARHLHPTTDIQWIDTSLPDLAGVGDERYDVILLSAVWMHVEPAQRTAAFRRLTQLLAQGGQLYITLRIGPAAVERAIYPVSEAELSDLADSAGLTVMPLASQPDLLGRAEIEWRSLAIIAGSSRSK